MKNKNKTCKREFTSHAFEAEINVKRVRVKIVQIKRSILQFNIKFGGPTVLFFLNDLKSRVVFMLCTLWFETMLARGTPER